MVKDCLSSLTEKKGLKLGATINEHCIPEDAFWKSVGYRDSCINMTTMSIQGESLSNLSSGHAENGQLWPI